ncbi:hypothetical protein FOL46_003668 [Perkinsus olseni]|uniref:Phospholipase/carboxylesterase/thioesterase domain-containing protein n=1 Tax=Perkinsus olseni TaxID=32597 RepID=A0A7J6M1P8_PEROL|nr:hypothetical protein FOL46_003668 [Perkinsus olseni]
MSTSADKLKHEGNALVSVGVSHFDRRICGHLAAHEEGELRGLVFPLVDGDGYLKCDYLTDINSVELIRVIVHAMGVAFGTNAEPSVFDPCNPFDTEDSSARALPRLLGEDVVQQGFVPELGSGLWASDTSKAHRAHFEPCIVWIYRLISALIGVAEDGEDATRTLSRARQLLDDFTRERTLKISLQNRIFSLARSSSIRLRPPEAKFDVTYIAPKDDEPPVMLLIVLHGFGDGKAALGKMAEKMQLPGVACLVLQGPHRLPSELLPAGGEEIGYYWFDNIDWARGGEPLTRRDESLERASLESLCKLSGYINETLIGTVGWTSSEIAFLGVGQGGTLALEIGRRMEKEFAGFFVLNPDELPLGCPEEKRRVPQRVVLVSGREDGAPSFSSVRSIESELASEGDMAQLHEQPGKAMDVLKDRNGKGEIFMRFIASRLAAVRMRSLGAEEVN